MLRATTVLLGCCLWLVSNAMQGAEGPARPNIVLLIADDLGWADLGCYGNKFNESPRIDALAKQGVRFTQFYAAGAVCSPTRASIASGQYQARLGLTAHIPGHWKPFEKLAEPPPALELPLACETLAERLKAAGYATGYLGKWHLGGAGFGPAQQGFDSVWEFTGQSVPGPRQQPPGQQPRRAAEYLGERAQKFIEEQKPSGQPFFLQVSYSAVHIPLSTTPALEAKYKAKPRVEGYSCHPLYAGLLEEMDASVGRIVDALAKHALDDNTIVIFTSDNGGLEREVGGWPGTLNRPLRNEKGSLYEGGVRVPLIVRWPAKITADTQRQQPAISVDFYPTLLAVADVKLPNDALLDGQDLQLTKNADVATERSLFWHYPHYHHSRPSGAIRRGDWKLIEFFDTNTHELYNLRDDLSEAHDLAAQEAEQAKTLREALTQWRKSVGAQMPQRNPAFDPKRQEEWWSRAKVAPTEAPGFFKQP